MSDVDFLRSKFRFYPDFPKKGVAFADFLPILQDPIAFETLITHITHHITSHTIPSISSSSTKGKPPSYHPNGNGVVRNGHPHANGVTITSGITHPTTNNSKKIDVIVALDARGFLLGPIIALRLGASFVPVRKKGKLPGETISVVYQKEYGTDSFDIQVGAIKEGDNVIVIDDVLATGGSAKAAGDLISACGGKTVEYIFVIYAAFLKGHEKLDAPVYNIIEVNE
ncbi:putative adenine phosphoribosyltransferase [Cantharellus anzutake]|uniref:putative adenine phosphoribosyltransferase n=1 Tax=Cantharellus anzutake TaxID=1750568 RepID=UPI001903BEEE|nr:putative adenine phosphoribosyltransferase [Cantharellus anzutake]KAF8314869.1 putative adenine phosphoribosyltransferase [Cantharellus anzutake]